MLFIPRFATVPMEILKILPCLLDFETEILTDKIGNSVKSAAWAPLGWKADMNGSMIVSVQQKYKVPLSGSVKGKGFFAAKLSSCTVIKSKRPSAEDGVYTIYPDGKTPKKAFCDMSTEGSGWTVFQKRKDGTVNFYRTWKEYKNGFGKHYGEYWLGNDAIHLLTLNGTCTLRVDFGTIAWETGYSKFSNFTISSESDGYRMSFAKFTAGTGGDAFTYHKGMKFPTYDRDNDAWYKGNCAETNAGAWWYRSCDHSNLNGLYGRVGGKYIIWEKWNNKNKAAYVQKTKMMIKC